MLDFCYKITNDRVELPWSARSEGEKESGTMTIMTIDVSWWIWSLAAAWLLGKALAWLELAARRSRTGRQ